VLQHVVAYVPSQPVFVHCRANYLDVLCMMLLVSHYDCSTQPGATAAGTTTTAAATSTTGAAASAATASSASNASTDSWTLALDSAAVQSMKARADALQRELDASRAQLVICKRDLGELTQHTV
jgi:hypothetical protein